VGAHQGPVTVALHPFHEQVRNPQREERTSSFASDLSEIEEIKHVGVPRLEVDGKCNRTLKGEMKTNGILIADKICEYFLGIHIRKNSMFPNILTMSKQKSDPTPKPRLLNCLLNTILYQITKIL
jgi:hypothetical protein